MSSLERETTAMVDFASESDAYAKRVESLKPEELVEQGLLTQSEHNDLLADDKVDNQQLRYFSRIVLYIDDLDRCPPDKVVEVLQACHLLLSFPLFVVVVAVDTRWVLQALLEEYEGMLRPESIPVDQAGNDSLKFIGTATARDYLEKIFQIPYWVRSMQKDSSESFAKSLIGDVAIDDDMLFSEYSDDRYSSNPLSEQTTEESTEQTDAKSETDQAESTDNERIPEPFADDAVATNSKSDSNAESTAYNRPEASKQVVQDDAMGWWSGTVDPNPKSLKLTHHERDFIGKLARQAGQSPRTIKRFVNIYRLLRTTLTREDLAMLVGAQGKSNYYRSIIAQLAILTGAPNLADEFFKKLDLISDEATVTTLIVELKANAKITESNEWPVVESSLVKLSRIDGSPQMLADLRKFTNIVRRYSFKARPS